MVENNFREKINVHILPMLTELILIMLRLTVLTFESAAHRCLELLKGQIQSWRKLFREVFRFREDIR